jgi:hypothetical protein
MIVPDGQWVRRTHAGRWSSLTQAVSYSGIQGHARGFVDVGKIMSNLVDNASVMRKVIKMRSASWFPDQKMPSAVAESTRTVKTPRRARSSYPPFEA